MTTTEPSNHRQATDFLANADAFLAKAREESGGIVMPGVASAINATVTNTLSSAQVRATLAVADAIAALAEDVRDLHETLRSNR